MLLLKALPTIVVVGGTIRRVICTLLAIGVVSTKIGMQMQVFKTVNLIVCLNVTDEHTRVGIVLLLHQRCKRVRCGLCIRSILPGIVVVVSRTNGLIVTSEELVNNIIGHQFRAVNALRTAIHRHRRIH